MKTDIYIATHKKVNYSYPDYCKLMQVNSLKNGLWEGYLHDSDGINISDKNYSYCELTVLYSLWKNSHADIKGLYHYRRFLGSSNTYGLKEEARKVIFPDQVAKNILKENDIKSALEGADILLPFPYFPYPFTALEDLQRYVYKKDIQMMIEIIRLKFSDYYPSLMETLHSDHLSYCNVFIARSEVFDQYCEWLFEVLKNIEEKCDISGYDKQHKRIYGYLSEVLLNVFVLKNHLKVCYHELLFVDEIIDKKTPVRKFHQRFNIFMTGFHAFPNTSDKLMSKARYTELLHYMDGSSLFNHGLDDTGSYYTKSGANSVEAFSRNKVSYCIAKYRTPLLNISVITAYGNVTASNFDDVTSYLLNYKDPQASNTFPRVILNGKSDLQKSFEKKYISVLYSEKQK